MKTAHLKAKLPLINDEDLLKAIAEHGTEMRFQTGELMMEPGKFIKYIPLVLDGSIKVVRQDEEGRELFLYYLEAGESCALSLTCCSTSKKSEIKAIAEGDTTILGIPVAMHERWMDEYRDWKDYVASTYQSRFQELLQTLDAVAFKRLDQRLMRYLSTRIKIQNETELHITHQEIANELGTSREVVSRLLKQLEKRKWVELGRNVIYLRVDFEELVAGQD